MSKVADPLREYIAKTWDGSMYVNQVPMTLMEIADQIDREHEQRMEQQSHDLRKAVCRYIGGVVDDYKHGHKRKSWLRQMKMQIELEALRVKEAKHEDH